MPTTPAATANAEAEIARLRRELAERDATLAVVLAASDQARTRNEEEDDIPAILPASTAPSARRTSVPTASAMIVDHHAYHAPDGMSDEEFARYLQAQEHAAARPIAVTAGQSAGQSHEHPIVHSDEILGHNQHFAPTYVIRSSTPPQLPNAVLPPSNCEASMVSSMGHPSRTQQQNAPATLQSTAAVRAVGATAHRSRTHGLQPSGDEAYAATLQQMEIIMAQRDPEAAEDPDSGAIDDPVWGRFETPAGKPFRPHTLLCIAVCPCCVPPLCSGPRKPAWRRAALSASFILAYIQILLWIGSLFPRGFAPASVNPMLGPWPDTLDLFQAKNAAEIVYNKDLWRLVMPIFLHAGLIHLATNMAMQLRMGITLEYEWGALRYLVIYMSSGIFASVYSAVMKPDQLSVGASGALMGVFGAWVSFLLASWSEGDDTAQRQRGFQFVMAVANIMVIIGFSFVPYVDWAAHIFGLLGGMLLGAWFFAVRPSAGANAASSAERARGGPSSVPVHNTSSSATSPITAVSVRRRHYLAYASLVMFLTVLLAGFLGLFFNTTPDRALLDFCESMRAAYPSYALTC